MSKNLNDFGTTTYDDGVDVANLPEQGRVYPDPPPTGSYRFQLPRLTPDAFDKIEKDGHPIRVKVVFGENAPLTILQPAAHAGEPFETTITNIPRERGKKGSGQFASDWDYLNQALKENGRPTSGADYVKKLIAKSTAETPASFSADIEYSWRCSDERAAYWPDGSGGVQQSMDEAGQPRKGCGKKYYHKDVQKDAEGHMPVRILCAGCGAQLKAFAQLSRIRESPTMPRTAGTPVEQAVNRLLDLSAEDLEQVLLVINVIVKRAAKASARDESLKRLRKQSLQHAGTGTVPTPAKRPQPPPSTATPLGVPTRRRRRLASAPDPAAATAGEPGDPGLPAETVGDAAGDSQ